MYINGKKTDFQTEFTEEGHYDVKIIIKDAKKLQSAENMFFCCSSLVKASFNGFDKPYLTNIKAMVCGCSNLESLDLHSFNTSNVEDMSLIFSGCKKLKEIKGISQFNTEKVTNMNHMFSYCYNQQGH